MIQLLNRIALGCVLAFAVVVVTAKGNRPDLPGSDENQTQRELATTSVLRAFAHHSTTGVQVDHCSGTLATMILTSSWQLWSRGDA